ncbi:unnamed protein product, partial [Prorocentrum cordatum]
MGKDAAKGYLSCSCCRYRWNWTTRTQCFSRGRALVPSPRTPPQQQTKGVRASGTGTGGGQQAPARPPGSRAPSRMEVPKASAPPQRCAGKQTVAELLAQHQQHVGQAAGAQELQALLRAVAPPETAQLARAPLLGETISTNGVACRRAEKAMEQAVAREDEAKLWLAECSQKTREAAVLAVRTKSEWQAELKAEPASDITTGSQITLSQLLGDESGCGTVEI